MKVAYAIAALLFAAPSTPALDVQRVEIIDYGIYTVDKRACERDAQGIVRCLRVNLRHTVTTWTVPAQLGVEFGLRYRIVGTPRGAPITVKRVWRLPEPGFHPPKAGQPIASLDRSDEVAIGETALSTYGFDDAWELVPGTWVIEFWYGDRKLDEKKFVVTKS